MMRGSIIIGRSTKDSLAHFLITTRLLSTLSLDASLLLGKLGIFATTLLLFGIFFVIIHHRIVISRSLRYSHTPYIVW